MPRPKKPTLSSDEINALKALAALAPTLVKQLSEPTHSKGGQNIPEDGELERRPPPPKGSGGKKKKKVKQEEEGGHVRVGKSPKLREKGKQGTAARREPMQIRRRPNLFDRMKESKAHMDDVAVDKKLWSGCSVQERGDRKTMVSIECSECGEEFDVHLREVKTRVGESGSIEEIYTCNDCELGKK